MMRVDGSRQPTGARPQGRVGASWASSRFAGARLRGRGCDHGRGSLVRDRRRLERTVTYRTHDVPVDGGALRVGEWGPDDPAATTIVAAQVGGNETHLRQCLGDHGPGQV